MEERISGTAQKSTSKWEDRCDIGEKKGKINGTVSGFCASLVGVESMRRQANGLFGFRKFCRSTEVWPCMQVF